MFQKKLKHESEKLTHTEVSFFIHSH